MAQNSDQRTPYRDDALRVGNGTKPPDIRDFLRRRTRNPQHVAGMAIWNYNNHELNYEALREQSDEFMRDRYMVPFQASGVWGYMVQLLPEEIAELEILTYDQESGEYTPFPNYQRHSEQIKDKGTRMELLGIVSTDDL